MSHQGQFPLSNRDVISVVVCPQTPNQLHSSHTHRFQDLLTQLVTTIGVQSNHLTESEMVSLIEGGIPCEVLQPGMDWQSGRLKLTLAFEADGANTAAPAAMETAPMAEPASTANFAPMAAVAAPAVAGIALAAMPAIEMPEMAQADLSEVAFAEPETPEAPIDLDEFTVSIDPMVEAAPEMAVDLGEEISAFAASPAASPATSPAPAQPEAAIEADELVTAALDDMSGLDDNLGSFDSALDAGFDDMPSLDDTNCGEADLNSAIAFDAPMDAPMDALEDDNLFEMGEPELAADELGQPVSLSDLEDELDFGGLDAPDHGTMVEVPRDSVEVAMASPDDSFDDSFGGDFDAGLDFESEGAAIEAEMNAALGFEDDALAMPSLGETPMADSLGEGFDFGNELDIDAPVGDAGLSLDGDFDLEMDLGDLAMDAAKMNALDPSAPETLSGEAKPTKAIDTESMDALGFDDLDNPWDLSDDLDAMLLSNGPLS